MQLALHLSGFMKKTTLFDMSEFGALLLLAFLWRTLNQESRGRKIFAISYQPFAREAL